MCEDDFKEMVRRYWSLEFHETQFPVQLFDWGLIHTRMIAKEATPSDVAQVLHAYTQHLKTLDSP